ncbi:MAG: hypothetical protein F6K36_02415 [Symploca sp. SIO3C6]|uniref:Clp R domain-containing protein n=1 Tax=Symploca sp. SIO1C4 TaxID=2607765 RepID=A0A6B3NID0_9CYAN|nr:hypothetical protein [Symploca sp. SIO3C6]NER29411.1 hypothetical protein [Symploca sp. SIO1C4]NET05669.1 hypothetical protein [Symploca sp. SIO2B6]
MFELFTEEAVEVVILAREESRDLDYYVVSPELLLLGLIRQGKGCVAKVFASQGINLESARFEVKYISRSSKLYNQETPFTPNAKKALMLSLQEADKRGEKFITAKHILLALIRQKDKKVISVLKNLGIEPEKLLTQLLQTDHSSNS